MLPPLTLNESAPTAVAHSHYAREDFLRDVGRIKEYILSGDAFQVLLARRMSVPLDFDTTTLYRALRALNPSPYMYHLMLDGLELVGSSPELLVRVADGRLTVRPIAGTRPRGKTADEDAALAAELLALDRAGVQRAPPRGRIRVDPVRLLVGGRRAHGVAAEGVVGAPRVARRISLIIGARR